MKSIIILVGTSICFFTILITVVIILSLNRLEQYQFYQNSNYWRLPLSLPTPSLRDPLVSGRKVAVEKLIKAEITINKTVLFTRSYRMMFNRRNHRKKKISFSQLWVVTKAARNLEGLDAGFIVIRRNSSLTSAIVGTFPVGSILIGRRIRIIPHENLNVLITRLEMVFPMSGWVTAFVSGSSIPFIHAVDVSFNARFTTSNISYRNNIINNINNNIRQKSLDFCVDGNPSGSASNFLRDVDLQGGDLAENGQASADSPISCCRLCTSDPNCKAWTWTSDIGAESDGQCWLKGGSYQMVPEGSNKDPNKLNNIKRNCVSGVIPQQNRQQQQQQQQARQQVRATGLIGNNIGHRRPPLSNKLAIPLGDVFVRAYCCNNSKKEDTFQPLQKSSSIFRSDKANLSTSSIYAHHLFDFHADAVLHVRDRRSVIEAAATILNIQRTSNDWAQQWPIGNGRFGALIGGSISNERIPISMAGFVVKNVIPSEPSAQSEGVDTTTEGKVFKEARELFEKGLIKMATSKLNELVKPGLGMFQYLYDLKLSYKAAGQVSFGPLLLSDGILDIRNGIAYSTFLEQCEPTIRNEAVASHGSNHEKGKSKISKAKKRNNSKIKPNKNQRKFASALRFHQREWFASEVDQVMVGYLTCRRVSTTSIETMLSSSSSSSSSSNSKDSRLNTTTTKSYGDSGFRNFGLPAGGDDDNCLHVSLQVVREAAEMAPQFSVSDMKQIQLSDDVRKLWSHHSKDQFKGCTSLCIHTYIHIYIRTYIHIYIQS